jgi:hypothetical protein
VAAAALISSGVGVAAAAVLDLGPFSDDEARPALASIEVEAADVVERWNQAVDAGSDDQLLADPEWVTDEELHLDVAEQILDTWGVLTLYRHPDQQLAGVDLVGGYVSEPDRARMVDTATTVVAAVSGLPAGDVARFVDDELGFAEPGGAPPGTAELAGARYVVERTARTLQLRVTAPDDGDAAA